jgi:hypothetical protein
MRFHYIVSINLEILHFFILPFLPEDYQFMSRCAARGNATCDLQKVCSTVYVNYILK